MNNVKTLFTALCCLLSVQLLKAADTNALVLQQTDITARLVADGFENVRVCCTDESHVTVSLEDNHYHSIYYGIAQALQIISSDSENREIKLIVLEDRMPRITLNAIHNAGTWDIAEIYHGGSLTGELSQIEAAAPSSYKTDLVLYPSYGLTNDGYDKIWSAHFAINPALEMSLWPGSHLLLQGHVPVWNNYDHPRSYGYNDKLGITRIVLMQHCNIATQWDMTAAVGLFSNRRAGIDVKGIYHLNNVFDLGIKAGYTAPWSCWDYELKLGTLNRFNLLAYVNYYEPRTNLQIELQAGQFLYEDKGIRMDVHRHYADYAVGLYGSYTDFGSSLGFTFSAPVGPRKMGRHRAFRLRAPESFTFLFDENTNVKEGHSSSQIGQQYTTHPEAQSHSSHYWQPEFLRKYILKELRKELK